MRYFCGIQFGGPCGNVQVTPLFRHRVKNDIKDVNDIKYLCLCFEKVVDTIPLNVLIQNFEDMDVAGTKLSYFCRI